MLWSSSGTGIGELGTDVSVYPNPASDLLHITLAEPIDGVRVVLYDMVGKAVFVQDYGQENLIEVPVAGLPEGLYVLSMESGSRHTYQKIMVKH